MFPLLIQMNCTVTVTLCFSIWPQYVKDRIKSTYMYFGGSLAITAASAVAAFRSPVVMNLVTRNGFMVGDVPFALKGNCN